MLQMTDRYVVFADQELKKTTNSMAHGPRRFNAALTRALQ